MASGFIAINDLKVLCKGKTRFRSCKVTFRHEIKEAPLDKTFKLSELNNFTLSLYKGEVICFADGVNKTYSSKPIPKPPVVKQKKQIKEEDLEPIEIEPFLSEMSFVEAEDKTIEMQEDFEYDKIKWVSNQCENERIKIAIKNGYDCNEAYIKERIGKEFPCFSLVDESTFYWKNELPELESLKFEQQLSKQINGSKAKYGTFSRCCILEKNHDIDYSFAEAIVIHNYQGSYEIIALMSDILKGDQWQTINM